MAGLCEGGNEHPGSLKAKDRDITYALFCSVLCIMGQVLFDQILILSVEENPHVYDKRRASYKDEKMKENTWLSIAASLNIDLLSSSLTHTHARIASLARPHATFYLPRNVCAAYKMKLPPPASEYNMAIME
ncbi:hypothetical protein ANN_09169 [Periplaneta americana]|uniref:MADF domain-containing protein n=1 Tax=Periplaneta americana TaxID=6978 RepID=A0ABQ8TMU7_PERAM|nr:hypothetical protein ANN_09169 [Periplaneta americana]